MLYIIICLYIKYTLELNALQYYFTHNLIISLTNIKSTKNYYLLALSSIISSSTFHHEQQLIGKTITQKIT